MISDKKVVVVLPAYKAAKTLPQTYHEVPFLLLGFVIVGESISLILEKFGVYKRTLPNNSIHPI